MEFMLVYRITSSKDMLVGYQQEIMETYRISRSEAMLAGYQQEIT